MKYQKEEIIDNDIENEDPSICDYYDITKKGKNKLKFTFISSNGMEEQCIVLATDGAKCKIFANGMEAIQRKTRFPVSPISEEWFGKEVDVEIYLEEGSVGICNGTYRECNGKKYLSYFDIYNAMKKEYLAPNKIRFYCNDYHEDEDFDDLVFDLEIIED